VPLFEVDTGQCDPRKCTGRKVAKRGLAQVVASPRAIPAGAVVLDPLSEVAFSPADAEAARASGIVILDCSWAHIEEAYARANFGKAGVHRALPFMLAANPLHYGQAMELSTMEAFAAALMILGQERQARELLGSYTWGEQFLVLNAQPLRAYAACTTSGEVVARQAEFLGRTEEE
jgi:pre-rRNA-processing protein TSR3